jgi:protease IV
MEGGVSKAGKIIIAVVIAVVVLYGLLLGAVVLLRGGGGGGVFGGGGSTIGVLTLDGVIASGDQGGLFGGGAGIDPVRTAQALRDADADDSLAAVVLRVNSPGGSPAASWEIYEAVRNMQKPVVVSVGDVDASGAYYFSSAADRIVAAPSSDVGSIGVILQATDLAALYDKVGVRYTVLTKGKYKDIGTDTRAMTDEERQILLAQMDVVYEGFIQDVAKGRQKTMTLAQVREVATGLAFPGSEALDLGLVDQLGTLQDATDAAAGLADLPKDGYDTRQLEQSRGSGGLLSLLLSGGGVDRAVRRLGGELAAGIKEGLTGTPGRLSLQ